MQSVCTEIDIDASIGEVWKVISALESWPSWNDVVRKMTARPSLGGKVAFRIHIDGLPGLALAARISEWEPEKGLAWRGGPKAIFSGNHYFRLEARGDDRTRFIHGEDFTGVVAALLMRGGMMDRLKTSYDRFNRSLKKHIELAH